MSDESAEYEARLAKLQRMATDTLPHGMRVNAEQLYAQAYDAMVREGIKPRLRAKYRIR